MIICVHIYCDIVKNYDYMYTNHKFCYLQVENDLI